jgi:hypothetical protein
MNLDIDPADARYTDYGTPITSGVQAEGLLCTGSDKMVNSADF